MTRQTLIILGILSLATPAAAATLGANCHNRAEIIVAPTKAQATNCAVARGCSVGFEARGGYYAIAYSTDGQKFSATAGGFRKKQSANDRAIDRCQTYSGGICAVGVTGHDNGRNYRNCN